MNFLSVILISAFGILLIATYGFGSSLATQSEVNKLGMVEVPVTSPETLIGMNLGTGSTVDSVTFTFRNELVASTTVSVSIKDSDGVEIGSGSKNLSVASSAVTVDLTDTVTATERPTLTSVSVTAE